MVRPSLDSLSATTFGQPGMCRALVTCFLVQQVKILHSRAQSGHDLMTPSLFMYVTTVVLSVATGTILLSKGLGTLLRPERTALIVYMQLASWRGPGCSCKCLSKRAPHPSIDASVIICRACFIGCNGWTVSTLSSFSHHCKGVARTWGLGSPFPVILGPSGCVCDATE